MSFTAIVDAFKDSSFGIGELFVAFKDFVYNIYNSDYIMQVREIMWSFFGQFDRLLPLALFAVFAVIAFFGKRIYPVLRFILFFIMGFGLGIYFLATPIIGMLPNMKDSKKLGHSMRTSRFNVLFSPPTFGKKAILKNIRYKKMTRNNANKAEIV